MQSLIVKDLSYSVDRLGFLLSAEDWTEDFADATAPLVGIAGGLTEQHWRIINYLRQKFYQTGRCPLLYFVCSDNHLSVAGLQQLFPAGYLRGLCRVAGITYREGYLSNPCKAKHDFGCTTVNLDKSYHVDVRGFLLDPSQWDRAFASHRAEEMGIEKGLSDEHWKVINQLRMIYASTGDIPTVFMICENLNLELEDLSRLFPTGYHRGAVKIAGLRVR